jgi:hypothetical protein
LREVVIAAAVRAARTLQFIPALARLLAAFGPHAQPILSGFSPDVLETLRAVRGSLGVVVKRGRCGPFSCSVETRLQALLIFRAHAFRYQTFISMPLHFKCGAGNLRPGFAIYSLYFEPAMVDACRDMSFLQSLVREGSPSFPHIHEFIDGWFQARFAAIAVAHIQRRLRTQPLDP